jgi:hypothetical protein
LADPVPAPRRPTLTPSLHAARVACGLNRGPIAESGRPRTVGSSHGYRSQRGACQRLCAARSRRPPPSNRAASCSYTGRTRQPEPAPHALAFRWRPAQAPPAALAKAEAEGCSSGQAGWRRVKTAQSQKTPFRKRNKAANPLRVPTAITSARDRVQHRCCTRSLTASDECSVT